MRRDLAICLFLVVAILVPYGQVVHHDFVNMDDDQYVYNNPHVRSGLAWREVAWAFSSTREDNWHPLTWLSHMLDCELFGLNPGYHHLVNVVFHILASVLLYLVFRHVSGAVWRSAMVAALFALHPLHVESVAWISERKDVLSTVFFMLTLGAYAHYAARPSWPRYGMVFALLTLGLMAKPMLVTVPFVLLLFDYWPLGRLQFVEETHSKGSRNSLVMRGGRWSHTMSLVVEKVPFFILIAASSMVTFVVQRQEGAMNLTFVVPFGTRLANALATYVTYVGKMLWPVHLAAFYPYREVMPTVSWAGAGMVLTGITVLVIWAGQRWQYLVVGWFWYLVTLVPVIGLVQVGGQSMADRYTYIPLIGLFIMLVWGISDLAASHRHQRQFLIGSGGVVILACMVSTWLQVRHWQNGMTVWAHALEVTKENAYAHSNYAAVLAAQGKMNEAISHYRETLRIVPRQVETRYKLARLLIEQGESDEALAQLQQLLRIYPGHSKAHNDIAVILDQRGRQDEALVHLREATRLDPNDADSQHNLGVVLAKQNKIDEAILHYKRAIGINPNYLDAHNKLAVLLARRGNREEAVAHFQEAVRLDPGSSELHRNLATALSDQGNIEKALLHYREAIRLNSKDPIPYNDFAWIRATHPNPKFRNGAEAIQFAEQACELVKEKNPNLLDTLAAAYAEAGRFPEAVTTVEEAISLAASVGPGGLVPELERRLQGYREGRPYREDERPKEEGER